MKGGMLMLLAIIGILAVVVIVIGIGISVELGQNGLQASINTSVLQQRLGGGDSVMPSIINLLAWLVWPVMALLYIAAVSKYCSQKFGSKKTDTIVITMAWLMPLTAILWVVGYDIGKNGEWIRRKNARSA